MPARRWLWAALWLVVAVTITLLVSTLFRRSEFVGHWEGLRKGDPNTPPQYRAVFRIALDLRADGTFQLLDLSAHYDGHWAEEDHKIKLTKEYAEGNQPVLASGREASIAIEPNGTLLYPGLTADAPILLHRTSQPSEVSQRKTE